MEKRILLVEDDAAFREVFTRALTQALAPEQLDVTFVEAGTLAEARTRLREGGLDAALIDVTMPDGRIDGKPGDLRGRPRDGGGREGGAFQGSFDARDGGGAREDVRRTDRGAAISPAS
jgi:CheY-like chemotaxis protein